MEKDTICALSTPYGISGIGIIRLSGPETFQIIKKIFKPGRRRKLPPVWKTHTVRYGYIVDGEKIVDEVLVTVMKSPSSYTREDMAEIGCHGGLAAIKSVITLCVRNGARLAQPGEFTKRAFLNGRIDLSQAESILEIVNAKTEKSLEIAVNQLTGSLSAKISEFRKKLMDIFAFLNYEIDFSEDYGEVSNNNLYQQLNDMILEMKQVLQTGQAGRIFTQGIKIAITGKPNVGKSSLLNLLVEEDRAIVSEIPGTTRDSIEAIINIQGIPFTVVDTAGIRYHSSGIEKIGVERAKEWMKRADMILVVLDSSSPMEEIDRQILKEAKNKPHVIVLNKCDLPACLKENILRENATDSPIVKISCLTGQGLRQLHSAIMETVYSGMCSINDVQFILNVRQQNSLEKAIKTLEELKEIRSNSTDIVAEMIRYSIMCLDEISGKNISDQVIDEIFNKFCIGK
ncbi:MAG TPA: tRNA uridine-5-carboxymethylaminomethyl(34) synthesis GTPase MnmE [bacterium]|nr:tRNA uridine-5-carboxymethylaminomethyl(34) synthesis GTPase MnmE [bacterium]HOL34912.1 tRNA uridine-5-carboxymethylaminomethyl(34) synthesis GTPase MnmE [bacterium]HPP08232.1 tRNA uridine-5-carboxymethylaminomethyl(34) synthesis GTPase MnmE [bacterium]